MRIAFFASARKVRTVEVVVVTQCKLAANGVGGPKIRPVEGQGHQSTCLGYEVSVGYRRIPYGVSGLVMSHFVFALPLRRCTNSARGRAPLDFPIWP